MHSIALRVSSVMWESSLLLPAREQGLTDLRLATNLGGVFLAGQDLQDCPRFLIGLVGVGSQRFGKPPRPTRPMTICRGEISPE
jgi:hypothetical protein